MYLDLLINVALLVALTVVSGFVAQRVPVGQVRGSLYQGILFGSVAIIGMLRPWVLEPGLIFDGRSIVLSLCAYFFGLPAALVSTGLAAGFRLQLGGAPAWSGAAVIFAAAGVGLLARRYRSPTVELPGTRQLYAFGLAVHVLMLLILLILLPAAIRWPALGAMTVPVLLIFPLATILVGRILADQTQTRALVRSLRESNERLEVTLRSIGDGVISTDLAGRITRLNPVAEALTGWPEAEARGRPMEEVLQLINATTREKMTNPAERVLREGSVVGLANHTALIARDGTERIIADSAAPIRDHDDHIIGVVLVISDHTAAHQAAENLRQSQKLEALGQLAGGVAHDFNNLLTVILGRLGLLKLTFGSAHATSESLSEIESAATRAATLTRQLLAFGRRQVMHRQDLDLREVVDEVAKLLRRTLGETVRLDIVHAPTPLPLNADRGMLEQVLLNLAINARDAMPRGGTLTVHTTATTYTANDLPAPAPEGARPGDFVTLTLRDEGSGIDPALLPHVFEPFFTTKEVGAGTGLGLATVHGIVRQHEGWVQVATTPGAGSTFTVCLPAGATTVAAGPTVEPAPAGLGDGETILLVEDELAVQEIAALVLRRHGYEVLAANHGPAALALWEQHRDRIALLFTDVVMPEGMSGVELAAQLRASRPDLPVLFASGYNLEFNRGHAGPLRPGQYFLSKPYPLDVLLQRVRQALDQKVG